MALYEEKCLFVALDHIDLLNLVTGSGPDTEKDMQVLVDKGLAAWTGEFNDDFMWKYHILDALDNDELYQLYLSLKNQTN